MRRLVATVALTLFGTLMMGTGPLAHDAHAADCVPGAQIQCACPGGGSGVQVCAEDGKRLGACGNCAAPAPEAAPPMSQPMSTAAPTSGNNVVVMEKQSPGMWATGLTFIISGSVFIPGGVGMMVGSSLQDSCPDILCVGGGALAGTGVALIVLGVVFVARGGKEVPVEVPVGAAAARPREPWKPTSIAMGPQSRLEWQF